MSNFDTFNLGTINATLRTFQVGQLAGLTPIRFEALTPDEFALWFRADLSGEETFLVLYQTDYVVSVAQLAGNIGDWYGAKPERFVMPSPQQQVTSADFGEYPVAAPDMKGLASILTKQGDYFSALAVVPRPPVTTYWGNVRRIRPGQDMTQALQHVPPELRTPLVRNILRLAEQQTADVAEQTRIRALAAGYDGTVRCPLPPGAIIGVTYEPDSGQTDIVYDAARA